MVKAKIGQLEGEVPDSELDTMVIDLATGNIDFGKQLVSVYKTDKLAFEIGQLMQELEVAKQTVKEAKSKLWQAEQRVYDIQMNLQNTYKLTSVSVDSPRGSE